MQFQSFLLNYAKRVSKITNKITNTPLHLAKKGVLCYNKVILSQGGECLKFKNIIKNPIFLIVISAILSALPLTFSDFWIVSWFSFVPLFYTIIKNSNKKIYQLFLYGFLFGFFYHICIYYWFLAFYPLDFANLTRGSSVAVVVLAWFGISLLHGILWCIPTVLCGLTAKAVKNLPLTCAVAIAGIIIAEKITQLGEVSFPWARISLGQYKATALIQTASIFGVDGVDIIILVFNSLIALCITMPSKRIMAIVSACAVFVANLTFGLINLNNEYEKTGEINILTVQGSIEQEVKWGSDGNTVCFNTYSSITKENITPDTDLVIWPESAVPKVYKTEKSLNKYKKLSKELDVPLLVGILRKQNGIFTNNASLIDKNGVISSYSKRHLVPFGEYTPYYKTFNKLFPFLKELNIIDDEYTCGTDTSLMQINGGTIGNIICFESIYQNLVRQSVSDGAELIVEVTNDSWLKDSPAMWQHLAHGVFRSIENGRYIVRSANSGVSAIIDDHGRILQTLEPNKQGVISDTVYFTDTETVYTKIGDVIFYVYLISVFLWFAILIIIKIRSVKSKN